MVRRWLGPAAAVPVLVLLGLLAGTLLASSGRPAAIAGRTAAAARAGGHTQVARNALSPALGSIVADVVGPRAIVYRGPDGRHPWRRYTNPTPQRTPLVFLVRARRGPWLRVMLPSRPNGSEGWVRAAAVELRIDPYSVRVDLTARRLAVRYRGSVLLAARVGVGREATPTPAGLYYIAELLRQPDPAGLYGPWAFALSAHSPVLSHFGGGDGQVGIHGTDEPLGIGRTVSHGCIRVRNSVIKRLAAILPLGTAVRVVRAPASSSERNRGLSRS